MVKTDGTVHRIETDELLHQPMSVKGKIKYLSILAFFKSVSRLAAVMPENVTYKFCVGISMFGYRRFSSFRKLARKHIEMAFGDEKSPQEIEDILKQFYVNQGKNLAEFLMIPYKSAEWVQKKIVFQDPGGNLEKEVKKGKGVVMVGAHIGNIEMACAWIGIQKLPMVTVVKAQRDEMFNRFLTDIRKKWGTEMIFRAQGVKNECFNQLNKGKIIGLVADQNAARAGVFVDFFGEKAATPTGAAEIAMKAGLPVLPGFWSTRNSDNTLTLHILEPIPMRDTGDRAEDLEHNVQLYTKAVEDFVRKYPAEYLWWHKRWKTRPQPVA